MDGHGDYSSARERSSRLSGTGPSRSTADSLTVSGYSEGPGAGGGGGSNGAGFHVHATSASELVGGRVSTPTALTTLASPYAPRYHLPTALPGSNFLMNSFLSAGAAAHSSEARKALVPDVQHFWSVTADSFPAHYLMAGGLYPPYPPLFPPPTESALSILGAGAGVGPGPSTSRHTTTVHYQRLLEIQKEAYLVAANHHLYGVPGVTPSALPPFLEQAPAPAHNNPPATIGLVKQEPKELSCTEKASRLAERRNSGVKIDLEHAAAHASSGRERDVDDNNMATRGNGRRDGGRHSPVANVSMGGIRSDRNILIHRDHKSLPMSSPSSSSSASSSSFSPSSAMVYSTKHSSVVDSGKTGGNNNNDNNSTNSSSVRSSATTCVSNGSGRRASSSSTYHHQEHHTSLLHASSSSSTFSSSVRKTPSNSPASSSSSMHIPANTLSQHSSSSSPSFSTTPRKNSSSSPNRRSTKLSAEHSSSRRTNTNNKKSPTTTSLPSASSAPPAKDSGIHTYSTEPSASSSQPPSSLSSSMSASSPASTTTTTIINIPSFRTSPVPLVSVQHDGLVLSALASPSSAALVASASASAPAHNTSATTSAACGSRNSTPEMEASGERYNTPSSLQQSFSKSCNNITTDSISRNSPIATPPRTHSSHPHPHRPHQHQHSNHRHRGSLPSSRSASSLPSHPIAGPEDKHDDDEEPIVVVDSTEDARKRMELAAKLMRDRAIEETIERVASAVSSDDDDDDDDNKKDVNNASSSAADSMPSGLKLASMPLRTMSAGKAYVTSSSSFRTVSSLSGQTLPSTLASSAPGCVSVGSAAATNNASQPFLLSALPQLLHQPTTSSNLQQHSGTRKVHAHTYVPEIGVFKGPTPKSMARGHVQAQRVLQSSLLSPPLTSPSQCSVSPDSTRTSVKISSPQNLISQTSPQTRVKHHHHHQQQQQQKLPLRDSTPSPCMLSPLILLSPNSNASSVPPACASVSPRALTETPDIASSLDSASVDSISLASGRSALDMNEDESDSSEESDLELTIGEGRSTMMEIARHHLSQTKVNTIPTLSAFTETTATNFSGSASHSKSNQEIVMTSSESCGLPNSVTVCCREDSVPIPSSTQQGFVVNLDSHPPPVKLSLKKEAVDCSLPEEVHSNHCRDSEHGTCFSNAGETSTATRITVTLGTDTGHYADKSIEVNFKDARSHNVDYNNKQRQAAPLEGGYPILSLPNSRPLVISAAHLRPDLRPDHHSVLPSLSSMETVSMSVSGAAARAVQTLSVLKTNRGVHHSRPLLTNSSNTSDNNNSLCRHSIERATSMTRCPSAPLSGSADVSSLSTPLTVVIPPSTIERYDRDHDSHGKGTIPVGIPVAQIRPHQFQAIKDEQRPLGNIMDSSSPSPGALHEGNNPHPSHLGHHGPVPMDAASGSSSLSHVVEPSSRESAPSVRAPSHINNPSLWLQQVNNENDNNNNNSSSSSSGGNDANQPAPPADLTSTTAAGVRFPLRAPSGFQFGHDPASGQIFLIPVPVSSDPDNSCKPLPRDPGRKSRHSKSNAKTTANHSSSDKPGTRFISTIGKDGSRQHSIAHEFANDNTMSPTAISTHLTSAAAAASPATLSPSSLPPSSLSSSSLISTAPLLPHQLLLTAASILSKPTVESRGCSPINFGDLSKPTDLSSLSRQYPLLSPSSKKTQTFSRAVQTCDLLLLPPPVTHLKKEGQLPNLPLKTNGNHNNNIHLPISSHSSSSSLCSTMPHLNPLSVQCPDIDHAGPILGMRQSHAHGGRREYNPFNDPQILQAADGLELLSTLAEKRPKSSFDDPKRIYPSPSDSFKSDTPSLAAPEDTLSPAGDGESRSGQCTPRRESRRDLSPKWSLPKKESTSSSSQFGDFKTPPVSSLELVDPVEVRERLAEVQRQYKQKQKELSKLPSRKNDPERKAFKRGPGRPPKNKLQSKKSDDDSSSSKTKDTPQPKKKRPAEELVDRVFRKLPPAKPAKVSRSIHYVKSKTGPFFKRKPAGSSSKRNRDAYGFDDKSWMGLKERKHKKKSSDGKSSKSKVRTDKMLDLGNLFTNIQGSTGMGDIDIDRRRSQSEGRPKGGAAAGGGRDAKEGPKSVSIANIKSEPKVLQIENVVGLSPHPQPSTTVVPVALASPNVTVFTTTGNGTTNGSSKSDGNKNSSSSSSSSSATAGSGNTNNGNGANAGTSGSGSGSGSHFTSSALFSSNSGVPTITFGSVHSIMETTESGRNDNRGSSSSNSNNYYLNNTGNSSSSNNTNSGNFSASSSNKQIADVDEGKLYGGAGASSVSASSAQLSSSSSSLVAAATAAAAAPTASSSVLSPSSAYGYTAPSSTSLFCTDEGSSDESGSGSKHKLDDDSDTDTSDNNSPNKKRKPGRPRKISTDKSSCGTETIWSKKSTCRGLLQISEPESSGNDMDCGSKMDPSNPLMKPLFLDEEWCRRRSERIFLNEPSPQPLPSPRAEPVWKLSNFMPKNTKTSDNNAAAAAGKTAGKSETSTPLPSSSPSPCSTPVIEEQTTKPPPSTPLDSPPPGPKKCKEKAKDGGVKTKSKNPLSITPSGKDSTPSPTPSMEKAKRAHENTKMKQQKAKSLHDLTQKVKKKYSKSSTKKDDEKSPSKPGRKRKASSRFSDSEEEPDVEIKDRPLTPEPRSAVIQAEDLKEGLNVLYLNDGLFYKGVVKAIQPPDVYGVLTAGQRGNRPHILCLEEILKDAVMDVSPISMRYLTEGTRICAFWSQQFSCLYPGTVAKTSPNPHSTSSVNVEFDDGDSGRIPIDHVRLLPPEFPIIEYEPDPLENLPKRRKPTQESKVPDIKSKPSASGKGSKDKKMTSKADTKDDDEDEEDDEMDESQESGDSDSDDSDEEERMWKWVGKSTKRPGLKGRARKEFYKSIVRGKETISVGDAAVFVSTVRSNCPYIGRIDSLWETHGGQKMVKVSWFYHPEETKGGNRLAEPKNALFESPHGDDNDVQTISHKCEVLSHAAYKRRVGDLTHKGQSIGPNLFYLAGFYDPTVSLVKFEPNVL